MGRIYKKGQILFAATAIPLISAIVLFWLTSFSANKMPLLLCLTFALIGFWSIIRILTDFAPYSLNKMHWYFVLVFMVIAPVLHYQSGWVPWGYCLSDTILLRANCVLLLWCFSYEMGRIVAGRKGAVGLSTRCHSDLFIPRDSVFRSYLLLLSLLSFICLVALVGFSSLAVRGEANLNGEGNPLFTVLNILLRAIPSISSVIVLLQMKRGCQFRKATDWFILGSLLIMTVVANNPVSMSRFWTAAVYLGIVIAVLPESWIQGGRFDLIVIIGLFVIFPFMGAFKTMSLEVFLASRNPLSYLDLASSFKSVDFDAHSLLCRILIYCDSEGLAWGRQLLSVVCFFVPRSILPIKGTPTGEMVAISQGQQFTNLSSPLMAEGYVDFGIIGVIVYAFVLGWFMRLSDDRYWHGTNRSEGPVSFFIPIYLTLFGFVMFIMRGPLQSTFLRLMGFLLFVLILYFLVDCFAAIKLLRTDGWSQASFPPKNTKQRDF